MNSEAESRRVSSGYEILQVYALEQHYEVVAREDRKEDLEVPGEEEEAPIGVNWDWRVLKDREFEVQFGVEMPPTADLGEVISVRFVLRAKAGEQVSIPPIAFVRAPAIAVLVPYIREAITSMSVRGPIGVRYLNPLNVPALAERFPMEESIGARQLMDDSDLAAMYGWEQNGAES